MKQKYLILLGLVILISISFLYFGNSLINQKRLEIRGVDRKIKKQQEILNSARVLDEELKEVAKVIENTLTDNRDFSVDETNAFIKQLADLADKYKIAVIAVTPKASYSATWKLEQDYTMEVTCTYVQFGQFMSKLESFDNIIAINSIDVRPIRKEKNDEEADRVTYYRITLELSTIKILKES